jgi:uncharacterized protein (DUF2141 family)
MSSLSWRIILLLFACFLAFTEAAQAADLTVTVGGLRNYRGSVLIFLWNDSTDMDKFPDPSRVQHRDERDGDAPCDFPAVSICRRSVTSLQDLTVTYTFHDLPEGDYALAVMHDENNNGLMDLGFLRRPLEGRGFSGVLPQDVHGFSRIIFARAAFHFDKTQAITVGLRYPFSFH